VAERGTVPDYTDDARDGPCDSTPTFNDCGRRSLLPYAPDWRWLLDRAESPWYPTIRFYRQPQSGEWDPLFGAVAQDLARVVADWQGSEKLGDGELSRPQVPVSWGELIDKITILEIK
jgi:hypothetical protein